MGHNFIKNILKKLFSSIKSQKFTLKVFFIYFSYPYSRTNIMAWFHLPGDPYFPIQGNGGWIEEDLEEDPQEVMEEEPGDEPEEEPEEGDPEEDLEKEEDEDEEDQENIDLELEVYNLPRVVRYPAPRQNFQGPMPR